MGFKASGARIMALMAAEVFKSLGLGSRMQGSELFVVQIVRLGFFLLRYCRSS